MIRCKNHRDILLEATSGQKLCANRVLNLVKHYFFLTKDSKSLALVVVELLAILGFFILKIRPMLTLHGRKLQLKEDLSKSEHGAASLSGKGDQIIKRKYFSLHLIILL
jgi:hypothetical protein